MAPPEHRSQVFGIAQAGMSLGQGTVMVLAGAAAGRYAPSAVIAAAGCLGTIVAIVLALNWHAETSRDEPQTHQHQKITPAPKLKAGVQVQVQLPVRMSRVLSGWGWRGWCGVQVQLPVRMSRVLSAR